MLENLIAKYKKNDVEQVVYQLSYAGKFIIVKGKTLAGSLIIIANTFPYFEDSKKIQKEHLYTHLYRHYLDNPGGRFRIKTLCKVGKSISQYELLKREQMELDKHKKNPLCLNNTTEAYIPLYNPLTYQYAWLDKNPVMNFNRWLNSKERQSYIKRYALK